MVASLWAQQAKTALLNLARWVKVRETGPGVAKIIWGVLGCGGYYLCRTIE